MDLALNNLQWLIYKKKQNKKKQTKQHLLDLKKSHFVNIIILSYFQVS